MHLRPWAEINSVGRKAGKQRKCFSKSGLTVQCLAGRRNREPVQRKEKLALHKFGALVFNSRISLTAPSLLPLHQPTLHSQTPKSHLSSHSEPLWEGASAGHQGEEALSHSATHCCWVRAGHSLCTLCRYMSRRDEQSPISVWKLLTAASFSSTADTSIFGQILNL